MLTMRTQDGDDSAQNIATENLFPLSNLTAGPGRLGHHEAVRNPPSSTERPMIFADLTRYWLARRSELPFSSWQRDRRARSRSLYR
jgi:hypothetical protein